MIVVLDKSEIWIAEKVGNARFESAISTTDDYNGREKEFLRSNNVNGAVAEMAVCKALNKYWHHNIGKKGGVDIEPNIQVRTTKHESGHLYVLPKDITEHVYILVIDRSPEFEIAGWLPGLACKNQIFFKKDFSVGGQTPRDLYWIPQSALNKEIKTKSAT